MTYISALDSVYEAELRVILILRNSPNPICTDYKAAIDTLATNAETLGVGNTNLNGTHRFASAEFKTRLSLVTRAVQVLALKELVHVHISKNSIRYSLTASGNTVANSLDSPYAHRFSETVKDILHAMKSSSQEEVIMNITRSVKRKR